jgi:hypothetical protein
VLSTVPPSSLSAQARQSEIAAILAAGIVRMKSRLAIRDPEIANDPYKSPPACLELSPESVLSVNRPETGDGRLKETQFTPASSLTPPAC